MCEIDYGEVLLPVDVFEDIEKLYAHFGAHPQEWPGLLPREDMKGRLEFLEEELAEAMKAFYDENLTEEERFDKVVDGIIDLVVVASGTLALMNVDGKAHFAEVVKTIYSKERCDGEDAGTGRNLSFDLRKPEGWKEPDHIKILKRTIAMRAGQIARKHYTSPEEC